MSDGPADDRREQRSSVGRSAIALWASRAHVLAALALLAGTALVVHRTAYFHRELGVRVERAGGGEGEWWMVLGFGYGQCCFAYRPDSDDGANRFPYAPITSLLARDLNPDESEYPHLGDPYFGWFYHDVLFDAKGQWGASYWYAPEVAVALLMYLFAGVIVARRVALFARRRRWAMRSRCLFCGYDLRGGGERCPECGRPTQTQPTPG